MEILKTLIAAYLGFLFSTIVIYTLEFSKGKDKQFDLAFNSAIFFSMSYWFTKLP